MDYIFNAAGVSMPSPTILPAFNVNEKVHSISHSLCCNTIRRTKTFSSIFSFINAKEITVVVNSVIDKMSKENKESLDSEKSTEYKDYDNLDSDDDIEENFTCDNCEYTCYVKSNLTKHVKSLHERPCDECDFVTSNKMHLKMHKKILS